jgi:ribosomal protein S13
MKNFWYSDEEIESEDELSYDIEEEHTFVKQKFKKMNRKENISNNTTFDEDLFDEKIALIVNDIHRRKKVDNKFSKWVNKNIEHLKKLYSLSNLSCSPVEFYNYIYENSDLKD